MLPNIESALRIKVAKSGKEFRADAMILPGTPPVGVGSSEAEAKYNLLVNIVYILVNKPQVSRAYADIVEEAIRKDWENAVYGNSLT